MIEENDLTEAIIGASFVVSNTLGAGFLEKVYENALRHELVKKRMRVEQQKPIQVVYDNVVVGDYVADMVVENHILVELKAVKNLDEVHTAQVLNYLKASQLRTGLLLNFGSPRVEIKRLRNG